jgi:hypothetical protein
MIPERGGGPLAIAIGMPVFGASGTPWGHVAAANARFVTIAQGVDGTERFDLPVAFVGRVHAGRVELTLAVADAR